MLRACILFCITMNMHMNLAYEFYDSGVSLDQSARTKPPNPAPNHPQHTKHQAPHTNVPQPGEQQLRVAPAHAAELFVLPEEVSDEELPELEEDHGRDRQDGHDQKPHPRPILGRLVVARAEGLRDECVACRRRARQEEEGEVINRRAERARAQLVDAEMAQKDLVGDLLN